MKYYDLNLKGTNYHQDKELILEAHYVGWDYLNLLYSPLDYQNAISYKNELIEDINNALLNKKLNNNNNIDLNKKPIKEIEIEFGLEINPKNQNELIKLSRKFRDKTKFISVLGGDLVINRSACENIRVDMLSRPYYKQRTCGINHVLAKEAYKNNVAIELCFNDILSSYLSYRSKIMAHFREIIKLHKKFKFPLVITTGASSFWDIRSPRDISAIFKYLGLSEKDLTACFHDYPKVLVDFNNERENMVVLGVKKINKGDKNNET
ncbi:MAG: ribonuclease P subunit P30 [Methanobrevibacter sp.]|nr:ribonuclease P subunit P30 [Methanobrevibacter sp.]